MSERRVHVIPTGWTPVKTGVVSHALSERGETLTETLVGLMIAALSLVMLSTAIASASNVIQRSMAMATTYQQSTQDLMPAIAEKTGDGTLSITGEGMCSGFSVASSVNVVWKESDLPGSRTGITYAAT